MKLQPVKGMCFVIEDKQDNLAGASTLRASGFVDTTEKGTGVTGVVYETGENDHGLCKGDHIVYSKFVAEQVILKDEGGKEIEDLKSVPTDAVLAIIR